MRYEERHCNEEERIYSMRLIYRVLSFGLVSLLSVAGILLSVTILVLPSAASSSIAMADGGASLHDTATRGEFNSSTGRTCTLTPPDALGPFYKPGAPIRSSVGNGYVLSGVVRSGKDCSPVPGARVEFWLAGPDGKYDDAHRATVISDEAGRYKFESNFPAPYSGRHSHIHVRVANEGFETLVTQHYPHSGQTEGKFDLVLAPQA